jgi:bifunctional lysine-specific demethylase and histidyl-hydroxylase MINA
MLFEEARATIQQFLAPLPVDDFLDRVLVGGFVKIPRPEGATRTESASRTELLGAAPDRVLLDAFHLAPKLTFHSANPAGPPPSLESVRNAEDFRTRIEQFHARNYSLRFPELRPLSPAVDKMARALEMLLHQPVTVSAFWSRGGMRAPVHYDDHDLVVIQLRGPKRWYISNKPSELTNPWRGIPSGTDTLDSHATIDVSPGDMLYLPRGTRHSVDSGEESLHLAVGFTPLTVREALIAAIDRLSELDPALRATIGGRLGFQLLGGAVDGMAPAVTEAAGRLHSALRTPGFLSGALHRRSARTIATLRQLQAPPSPPAIDLDTVVSQADMAFCHLSANDQKLDFSYPGGHLYIHRGAQQSLLYMVSTPRFRVRDIPGDIADDVRLSLTSRLLEVGFLRC